MTPPSIVTLTMNPALDVSVDAEEVCPTDKIRCRADRYDPGGGGINVARFAHALGASVSAVFAAGGPAGARVSELLDAEGVPNRAVPIAGCTRESFTVNERSTGRQYRFVLPGPHLSLVEQSRCLREVRAAAAAAEFVVASGSLPSGVPSDFYQRVAEICTDVGAALILDTSGGGLAEVRSGVFLLKPSVRELRELAGSPLETADEQVAAARELIANGVARAVVVSLGARGALLVTAEDSAAFPAIAVHAVSGVGAGDAMVAGIAVALGRGWPLERAVRYGIAAGTAKLLTVGTARFLRSDVDRLAGLVCEAG